MSDKSTQVATPFLPGRAGEFELATREYFDDWALFEKAWLVLFVSVAFYVHFTTNGSLLGLTASVTGMITVVLVAKGRISNYYFGIINVVLYGYIAMQSQYYGEVMLNWAIFLPMQFIGLYLWTQNANEEKDDTVEVSYLSNKERVGWIIASVVSIGLYGMFLKWLNGNLPFFDSTSTVLSVIAQLLMLRRVTAQWVVWIIIDIVSIYMWVTAYMETGQNAAMIVMWTAYLVNAFYGLYNWRKMEGA